MEEQINQPPPSKEDIITFLKEQMEVKEAQYKLQELNTKLAVARAEELKALQFIAQMTNPTPPEDAVKHNLTEEDLEENPELSEQGFKVGDEVLVAKESVTAKRKLKK
jgi:uncharacterized protein YneF (UPF0154 family)